MDLLKRLTTDKPNTMMELAFNSCYVGNDRAVRYRDFSTDIDARDLARKLMVAFGQWTAGEDNELVDNDIFDETMLDNLFYDVEDPTGLIALFYRNLWAMAELREQLKMYEDTEEKGLLLKLHFGIGDVVYEIVRGADGEYAIISRKCITYALLVTLNEKVGETVFLTKEEAKAALKKMKE